MYGDPNCLDVAWLARGLRNAGLGDGLINAELDGFIGTGQTGSNARIRLTWSDPAEGGPATVVAKYPSLDEHARSGAFERGTYYNEWDFYTNLVGSLRVRAPRCYLAHYSHEPTDFVLIMEDLAGSKQGDQFVGLTVDQAALGVEQAVALHAPLWGDPKLDEFSPQRARGDDRANQLSDIYSMMVEPFLERLGAGLDADVIDLTRQLIPKMKLWAHGTDTPETVVHYDFRPDNFMFGVEPDAPKLAVVDWQTVRQGNAMFDLAYMIGGSFEPGQRAAVERALLADYRSRLTADGINYRESDQWRDYRLASIWGVVMSVIATILAAETERGNRMLTTMAQRHGRHAIDLQALDLLQDS